jgi:hypothetical protein
MLRPNITRCCPSSFVIRGGSVERVTTGILKLAPVDSTLNLFIDAGLLRRINAARMAF